MRRREECAARAATTTAARAPWTKQQQRQRRRPEGDDRYAPTMRDLDCDLRASMILISSSWGMPSVMATMRPTSASIASMMAAAAPGGGT